MSDEPALTMTVGDAKDGRTIAVITSGGHPQRPESGDCTVEWVEDVTGWTKEEQQDWFKRVAKERPWETRQ